MKAMINCLQQCMSHLPASNEPVINQLPLMQQWCNWAQDEGAQGVERRHEALLRLQLYVEFNKNDLDLSGLMLTQLPVQWPTSLQWLNVENNQLTSLPAHLPDSLLFLNARDNQLTSLPDRLPTALQQLDVTANQLEGLPPYLPLSLQHLYSGHNQLKTLPYVLPPSLKRVTLSNNQLDALPLSLPPSLVYLDIASNQITALPSVLPPSLTTLRASHNALHQLPQRLPDSLNIMDVEHNRLTALPLRLPPLLKKLNARQNQLNRLPDNLPALLQTLNVSHNQLTQLPMVLPGGLQRLEVSANQLTALPLLPISLEQLYIDYNPVTTLPTQLSHLIMLQKIVVDANLQLNLHCLRPDLTEMAIDPFIRNIARWTSHIDQWHAIKHEQNAEALGCFLQRLACGYYSQDAWLKEQVANWLDQIAQQNQRTLRAQTLLMALEANRDVIDHALIHFNQMNLMMTAQLISPDLPVSDLFNHNRDHFRLQLVEKIAVQQAAAAWQPSIDKIEEIGLYLAYQCQLRYQLSLPFNTTVTTVTIDNSEIARLLKVLLAQEKRDFIRYLIESISWMARLKQWDSGKIQAIDEATAFTASMRYQQYYQLSRDLLANHQAIHLLAPFDQPDGHHDY